MLGLLLAGFFLYIIVRLFAFVFKKISIPLTKFIISGRTQALFVTLVGSFFPLVGTAAVGLVTLCKGYKEGFLLCLWVSLPLIVLQQISDDIMLPTATYVASLGIMVVVASLHSFYASWQWTLISIVLVAIICAATFGVLMSSDIATLITVFQEMSEAIQAEPAVTALAAILAAWFAALTEPLLLGLIAITLAVGSVMSLLLARWLQSVVYNPSGFQKEFHSFKIETKVAVILVAVLLAGQFMSKSLQIWSDLAALPLLIAGIALVHFAVKLLDQGRQWWAFLYVGIILAGKPVTVILLVLGLTDSLIDLRSRLEGYKNSKT